MPLQVVTFHGILSVISVAITTLLKELEAASDPALTSLSRTSWAQLTIVSGPSAHIETLVQAVEIFVALAKDRIEQKKYLRNFLDKGAKYVI
jgi:hypothetical protein